jgi:molybdopterin-guanine dinucleotide biosynthesis protein A
MAMRTKTSAIVLAGGRSSRFGTEKMAAELDGEPLLHHAMRAAAVVCDEVLVVGAPAGLPVALPEGLTTVPIVVLDQDAYQGPLVALPDAACSASHERLLLIGGDMPNLVPAVLRRLLVWEAGREGACLVVDDWVQPFPMGLDRDAAQAWATGLVRDGERSLRALISALNVELIPEEEWRALDPEALSLRDIDRPEDLDNLVGSIDSEPADVDSVVYGD